MFFRELFEKAKESSKGFRDAFLSCMVMMVKGNLAVLSFAHFANAFKVGVATMVALFVCNMVKPTDNKWILAWTVGTITAVVDAFAHDHSYGSEAVLTGVGAFVLAMAFTKVGELGIIKR